MQTDRAYARDHRHRRLFFTFTGGTGAISTDFAALEGARQYAEAHGRELRDFFEAWIPEPLLDKRPELQPIRMTGHDGISVQVVTGRTPLGRRLSMVAAVDMVLTISGKRHTEVVVEQALDLGIPVLPIPNFGGDSEELLSKYRERIGVAFAPNALDECLSVITRFAETDPGRAAARVVDLLQTAKSASVSSSSHMTASTSRSIKRSLNQP